MVIKRVIKKGIYSALVSKSPVWESQPVCYVNCDVAVIPPAPYFVNHEGGCPHLPQPFSGLHHWLSVLALNLQSEGSSISSSAIILPFCF